jgi:hypothetical protein
MLSFDPLARCRPGHPPVADDDLGAGRMIDELKQLWGEPNGLVLDIKLDVDGVVGG